MNVPIVWSRCGDGSGGGGGCVAYTGNTVRRPNRVRYTYTRAHMYIIIASELEKFRNDKKRKVERKLNNFKGE